MVESTRNDYNLSRRSQNSFKDTQDQSTSEMSDYIEKSNKESFENEVTEGQPAGILGRLTGTVYNTTKFAAGTAYGGVTWVAGGVLSTAGSAVGATYNTVTSLSPLTMFKKDSKSKSD